MTTRPDSAGPNSRRALPWIICCALGVVVAVVGLILVLIPTPPASFGWFAYVPLSDAVFSPAGSLLSPLHQAGFVVSALGIVIAAFAIGWWFGRRQSRPRGPNSRG